MDIALVELHLLLEITATHGGHLVGIKNADFGFELLPKIITSLKGNSLYL